MPDADLAPHADTIVVSPTVLRDLRRDRQRRRIAGIEWFEALYRAYLTGGIGLLIVLFLSSAVGDDQVTGSGAGRRAPPRPGGHRRRCGARRRGRTALGQSGRTARAREGRGAPRPPGPGRPATGPAAARLEAGPLRHLRRRRRRRHRRPAGGSPAAGHVGAVGGQRRAGRRARGAARTSAPATSPAGCGCPAGWPPSSARSCSAGPSPTSSGQCRHRSRRSATLRSGRSRRQWLAVLAIPAVVGLVMLGLSLLNRLSLESAERRTALVGQLRFAATVRDLRTVMVLRRQLVQEQHRTRPVVPPPSLPPPDDLAPRPPRHPPLPGGAAAPDGRADGRSPPVCLNIAYHDTAPAAVAGRPRPLPGRPGRHRAAGPGDRPGRSGRLDPEGARRPPRRATSRPPRCCCSSTPSSAARWPTPSTAPGPRWRSSPSSRCR